MGGLRVKRGMMAGQPCNSRENGNPPANGRGFPVKPGMTTLGGFRVKRGMTVKKFARRRIFTLIDN
jgi:hypothetical protein